MKRTQYAKEQKEEIIQALLSGYIILNTSDVKNLIHYPDQCIQYFFSDFINLLKEHGIRISMSTKGYSYDNAYVITFFKTLKQEEVYLWQYGYMDVIINVPCCIEDMNNRKRLYFFLSYRPPEGYQELFADSFKKE
jgi:putative transposase